MRMTISIIKGVAIAIVLNFLGVEGLSGDWWTAILVLNGVANL